MQTFLHVGCGPKRKERTTRGFNTDAWSEIRLDIDPSVSPDVTGTMTDMASVSAGSVNAVFSSHNIEHLYPHEVPLSLAQGNLYMAHRCGFTEKVLSGTLRSSGFKRVASMKRGAPYFDLWALATKADLNEEELLSMAKNHFTPR